VPLTQQENGEIKVKGLSALKVLPIAQGGIGCAGKRCFSESTARNEDTKERVPLGATNPVSSSQIGSFFRQGKRLEMGARSRVTLSQ